MRTEFFFFFFYSSTQEGTVPHRDKPARIPWPAMCCACAVLVCSAGRAHLGERADPHPLMHSVQGTLRCVTAAAGTFPRPSSRPRPAITVARAPRQPSPLPKPLHTAVNTSALPHRSSPAPQNCPPHAGSPHAAQSRNAPGPFSRTTPYRFPASGFPPFCTLSRPTGARSAAVFAARGPRAPRRRGPTSLYPSASPAAAGPPPPVSSASGGRFPGYSLEAQNGTQPS